MAIASMEKLTLTFKEEHLEGILRLIQAVGDVHIESEYESLIPPAKKAEVDKTIRETEKNLQRIQAARSIIKGHKPTNLIASLRNSGERILSIPEFIKAIQESDWEKVLEEVIHTDRWLEDNRNRRKEVSELLVEVKRWEQLSCNPLDFGKLHRASAFFGSVHEKHVDEFSSSLESHEEEGIIYERCAEIDDRDYFLLICHSSAIETLNNCMNEFSFSPEEYPFDKPPREAKRELENEERRLIEEEKEIDEIMAGQQKNDEILALAEDHSMNILLRQRKALEIIYHENNIVINGWIVSAGRKRFENLLSEYIPHEDYLIEIREVKERDIDDVPIKLKNSKLVSVYERLTEMYSLPKYYETDPTPVLTIFYMIFFGMMVSDLGYGIAIFLVGLIAKRLLNLKRSTVKFVDFLFYLSFPIMGWGLIFGSFCGLDMPVQLISFTVHIIPMSIIAIALGYLHIMAGLVMQMINQVKRGNYYEMISGGLSWFSTFLGIGLIIIAMFVPWLLSDIQLWIGIVITGAGVTMTIIVPAIQYGKRWYAGIGKGLYALYGITGYLGDFVSYTRLMALGVAGGSVALAFNTILAIMPLPIRFTLGFALAIILHGLNIALSMLSAYVHGIRLQFVEFFGKFYSGGGKRFEPFKAAEKNVIFKRTREE